MTDLIKQFPKSGIVLLGFMLTVVTFAADSYLEKQVKAHVSALPPSPYIVELQESVGSASKRAEGNAVLLKDIRSSQRSFEILFIEYLSKGHEHDK